MSNYRDDLLEYFENRLFTFPDVEPKMIFGHPGFSIMNRIFCFLYEDGLSIKLPGDIQKKILRSDPNARPFSPGGTPMGTWVVLTQPDPGEYHGYWELIELSMDYITTPEAAPPKKRKKRPMNPLAE